MPHEGPGDLQVLRLLLGGPMKGKSVELQGQQSEPGSTTDPLCEVRNIIQAFVLFSVKSRGYYYYYR